MSELLDEEARLKTQVGKRSSTTSNPFVLVVPSKPIPKYHSKPLGQVFIDE